MFDLIARTAYRAERVLIDKGSIITIAYTILGEDA
jgi:hypothetical protein